MDDDGFSLVEILSPCPTNWKKTPEEAWKWIEEVMSVEYKPGVLVDRRKEKDEPNKGKETAEDVD